MSSLAAHTPSAAPAKPPYPPSPVIARVEFDFTTHQRHAPGSDNWPTTWADDGHLYTAWGDGGGFGGTNSTGRVLLGVARVEGDAHHYVGKNIWGGFEPERPAQFGGKSYGILSVGGVLYMWVVPQPNPHLDHSQIAWSKDRGRPGSLPGGSSRFLTRSPSRHSSISDRTTPARVMATSTAITFILRGDRENRRRPPRTRSTCISPAESISRACRSRRFFERSLDHDGFPSAEMPEKN